MKNNAYVIGIAATLLLFANREASSQYAWTKDVGNPVLSGGGAGSWNYEVLSPFVLFNSDSARFEMWYAATPGPMPWKIGFAISEDGSNWTAHPSAVLSADQGSWDQYNVNAPCVIRESGSYKMWYQGSASLTSQSHIGYATSSDGIHWTKYIGNPVMDPGAAAWEATGPMQCCVMPVSGGYKMWFTAGTANFDTMRIGYATSVDGIAWRRDTVNNPVLNVGGPGQWDSTGSGWASVFSFDNNYFIFYQGPYLNGYASTAAGWAWSSDGITNWTKHSGNPFLTITPGGWDGTYAELATVVLREDTVHGWYDAKTLGKPFRIGHVTSPWFFSGVGDERNREIPERFVLAQNYPNPFNPSTVISYQLPRLSDVRLVVYDLLGRDLAVLVDGKKAPGSYGVQFDASRLSSGVYFYKLQAGSFFQTRKMIVAK